MCKPNHGFKRCYVLHSLGMRKGQSFLRKQVIRRRWGDSAFVFSLKLLLPTEDRSAAGALAELERRVLLKSERGKKK